MKAPLLLSIYGLALVLTACSEQPAKTEKKVEKPAEAVTGQSALFHMYQVARSWSSDAQILQMHSMHLTEIPDVHGKAGAWQATFASQARNQARVYTYSVIDADPNLHQGVFPSQPESWAGPSGDNEPFLIAAVKVDSDAAYKTALKEAGAAGKANAKQTIAFVLDKQKKFTNPSWRVIWGESIGTSGLSEFIDASTGEYLETMH